MFCSNCGTEVTERDVFCPECGQRIEHPPVAAGPEAREPVVIPESEPVEAPAAPVAEPAPEPAEPKKKSKKGLIIGVVAAVVALALAAAVIFWLVPMLRKGETRNVPADPKEAVIEARKRMDEAGSVHTEMKVELRMNAEIMGRKETADVTANYIIDTVKEPLKTRVEIRTDLMGQTMNVLCYAETVDGKIAAYLSADGGAHWMQTEAAAQMPFSEEQLLNAFTEHADQFRMTGTETVNGSPATVYSCELDGAFIEEVMKSTGMMETLTESLGTITDDLLKDLGPIRMTMSIDDKTGYPVHYTVDMTDCMGTLYQRLIAQMMGNYGSGDEAFTIDLETCTIDMTASDFNEVDFEIPDEVRH